MFELFEVEEVDEELLLEVDVELPQAANMVDNAIPVTTRPLNFNKIRYLPRLESTDGSMKLEQIRTPLKAASARQSFRQGKCQEGPAPTKMLPLL